MGGTSYFLQSQATCYQHSFPVSQCTFFRNGRSERRSNKRSGVAVASLMQWGSDGDERVCRSRRNLLFMSAMSLAQMLQPPARAVENLSAVEERRGEMNLEENKKREKVTQSDAPSASPMLSFLNVIGIIGSGVLGVLYAVARQEQDVSESKMESLMKTLSDKEAFFKSMKKNYESKILDEQEEHAKQLKQAKDEKLALISQLDSANSTMIRLGQELQREKKALQDARDQVDSLQSSLSSVEEDKKGLETQLKEKVSVGEALQEKINSLLSQIKQEEEKGRSLVSSLSEKESELNELKAAYGRSTEQLVKSSLTINKMEEELRDAKRELGLKNTKILELNAEISALVLERDELYKKINEMQKQYDDLMADAKKKAKSHAELVAERDLDLARLREKLEVALSEVSDCKDLIADLTNERDGLKETLHMQVSRVRNLKDELESTKGSLETSRTEALEADQMLNKSRQLCSELESEVLRVQAELAETKQILDETKHSKAMLINELGSANELLEKTVGELKVVSDELAAMQTFQDDLQKQLADVQKKADTAASELNEEKKIATSVIIELQNLEKQISIDKEARRSLETDLEETTKSLDQVNRNMQLLTKDLELAKSQISNLEDEKDAIYKSLADEKNISQGARENLEDAHNLVMRLGTEREILDKKAKKLEEELAAAKGEILRLRRQMNSSKTSLNTNTPSITSLPESGQAGANAVTTSAKKTTKRKKSSST